MPWIIEEGEAILPDGVAIRRFIQVSNGGNSTITSADINTTSILPLLGTGSFNDSYNNPLGYGSLDLANNWIDVSKVDGSAGLRARVTITKNGGGTVLNPVIVMRLIQSKSNPGVFTEIANYAATFSSQTAPNITGFHGGIEAVQFGIRTAQSEDVRLNGVYFEMDDIV